MSDQQGYYSLVQYSEYPEREEFVNIGVVLFADMLPHVSCKFVERPNRIERVFNSKIGVHFEHVVASLQERLRIDFSGKWNREEANRFIHKRSGKLKMSSPRSVHVENPNYVLDALFSELVGELPRKTSGKRAATKLKDLFRENRVERFLDSKPDAVPLPSGLEVKAHYGYQNGSYNLIRALDLGGGPEQALKKASPDMIEGRLLSAATADQSHKKLIVVGDVEGQSVDFISMISDQMNKHDVGFYQMNSIGRLVDDINRNAANH